MFGFTVFLIANIPSIKQFLPESFLVNIGFAGVLFFCGFSRRVIKNDFTLRLSANMKLFLFLLLLFVLYGQISVFFPFQYMDDYVFLQSMKYLYIIVVSALILFFAEKQDMKVFAVFQALWGVFVAVASIAGIWEYSDTQHYCTVAAPIGAAIIMFLSYAVFAKSQLKGFLLTSPFIILLLLALFLLPSRGGPLFAGFAFLVIILIDIFYTNPFSRRVLKTGFYLLIGLLVLYFYQNHSSPRQAYRMHRLFAEIGTEQRIPLLLDTVHKIIDNPMGYGMGSSVRIVGFYPHNMFLESMLEFGILPTLVFFLVVIVYPIRLFVLAIKTKDQLLLSISVLILYLFLIFSVSYSAAHMYIYFSVVSLALSHQNIVSLHKMEGKI